MENLVLPGVEGLKPRFSEEGEANNYELSARRAQKLFLNYDQKRMIRKFQLKNDGDFLYLGFLGDVCRISRTTGEIWFPVRGRGTQGSGEGCADDAVEDAERSTGYTGESAKRCEDYAGEDVKQCTDYVGEAAKRRENYAGEALERRLNYNETMSIFDFLCHDGVYLPQKSGRLAPVGSVGHKPQTVGVEPFHLQKYAKLFDLQPEKLRLACRLLGGREVALGDIGYEIPVFYPETGAPWLSATLKFYRSDEEFDASLIILWDTEILCFLRYETIFYVESCLCERLSGYIRENDQPLPGGEA